MRIYLDNCCYNRPFDDQRQERIHMESEAVFAVLRRGIQQIDEIIGSSVLELEIDGISNDAKKEKVKNLYKIVETSIQYTEKIYHRAEELSKQSNIRSFDHLHIASAEQGNVEMMLTTDDKLIKQCSNIDLTVKVMNPLNYIMEVFNNE